MRFTCLRANRFGARRAVLCATFLLLAPAVESRGEDAEKPAAEISSPAEVVVENDAVRIDLEPVLSAPWRAAIDAATKSRMLPSGGQLSLLRVVLEAQPTDAPVEPAKSEAEPLQVNGIPLFIPAGDPGRLAKSFPQDRSRPAEKPPVIQLSSVKLLGLGDVNSGGGGMYRELQSGDFVIVEHINNSRRRDNRDCMRIGSTSHQQGELWVPVPPRGQLGIVGDIVLKRTPPTELGRIVVEVIDRSKTGVKVQNLQVGNVVVGGSYGSRYPFVANGISGTPLVSPGPYKILLPDFDMEKSRWDVTVEPGQVTYLRFVADSQQNVRLEEQKPIAFADAARPE